MNILESLRKIENKIYREQDKSIDLQGMFLKEDVDKEKLWEMITNNDIDGVINLLESDNKQDILNFKTWGELRRIDPSEYDMSRWKKIDSDIANDGNEYIIVSGFGGTDVGYVEEDFNESDDLGVADWEVTDFGDDPVGEYPWSFITSKSVKDFDGFWTDYSLWMEWTKDEEGNLKPLDHFVFIFGDKSVYTPENSDWDWEADSAEEAQEWFDNYTGFEDEDLDESLNDKELKESKKGTVEQMWDGDTYSYHLYVDGKKVGSFWEFDEVEDFAKNHDIILEESLNKKNLKESSSNDLIGKVVLNDGKTFPKLLAKFGYNNVHHAGNYVFTADKNNKTYRISTSPIDDEEDEESPNSIQINAIEESFNKKNLKESVYTENGFKNRKEYLNSLADDFGVDVQTVYDLASVLGPDEDFDALVTELEDVAYSQDDDHDGDTEYVGKQFGLTSYYDDKLRGVEDYIELNWGDDPDLEDWIWDKCSQGHYVVLRDWSNGEETKFRPVEEDDIDVKDLMVSKSGLFGTDGTVK